MALRRANLDRGDSGRGVHISREIDRAYLKGVSSNRDGTNRVSGAVALGERPAIEVAFEALLGLRRRELKGQRRVDRRRAGRRSNGRVWNDGINVPGPRRRRRVVIDLEGENT